MSLNPTSSPVLAVLGAGPGIGEAVARRFASEGFIVALLARTESKLADMCAGINADFPVPSPASPPQALARAHAYPTDLSLHASITASLARLTAELGRVSVLVYNAGARRLNGRTLLNTSPDEFESFTRINLFGAWWATREVLPGMLRPAAATSSMKEDAKAGANADANAKPPGGTIIYTGATASLRGSAGLSSFAPGKFGLRALSQVVAREYQEWGVHVCHVVVDTPVDGKLVGGWTRRRWEREGKASAASGSSESSGTTTTTANGGSKAGEDSTGSSAKKAPPGRELRESDDEKEWRRQLGEGDRVVEEHLSQPSDLAELYWMIHKQPRSAWTQELDVRAMRVSMYSRM